MKSPLRILLVEDTSSDAELIMAALADGGLECDAVRVETRADFVQAIEAERFDLILSDCSMPCFDGFSALKIAREKLPETPFIFVSGTLGEENAIETLKNGATDYVLKHRLARLCPAVSRAIAESEERAARQAAERSRTEAESLFRVLFEQVPVGVAISDLNGRIVTANRAFHAMLGYGEEDLSKAQFIDLMHPEDAAAGVEAHKDLLLGNRASDELERRFLRRDGVVLWGRVVVSLIRGSGGVPRFFVSFIEDITSRREQDLRFIQAGKMEVVGRLAAEFAHDFNNLLTIINGYSDMLLGKLPQRDPARQEVGEIRGAGERATTLTRRILTFSRQKEQHRQLLDLNSVVGGLEYTLRRLVGDETLLTMRLDRLAAPVELDQIQLEQVVLNLVINARDAMPEGGELTIATGNTRLEQPDGEPRDYVELVVSDTGCGMDETTKSRIFEPFFTTKAVGKGTGLGLWIVREMVQQSCGVMTLHSEPGKGASFRICLPASPRKLDSVVSQPPKPAAVGGAETVLVVEDDESVRLLIHKALKSAGYRVIVASDGLEALAMTRDVGQIDVLITDVVMPGMRGPDVAVQLAAARPDIKVIYISGYADQSTAEDKILQRGTTWLQKPFTHVDLLQTVRKILRPVEISVLIVDDDAAIRNFLQGVLRSSGYRTLKASTGRQAVQQLRHEKVDVLVIDLIMPDQEGLETIEAVIKEFPDLRVVAMSGGFGEQFLSVARKLGAHAVLHKPFGAEAVTEVVRKLVESSTIEASV